jgi:hypothetical protein
VSTILDALRKLQRERAAANPARDLRGSVTGDTSRTRSGGKLPRSRWPLAFLVLLAALGGGGAWAYRTGKLARFMPSRAASDSEARDSTPSDKEIDDLEREMAEAEAKNPSPDTVAAAPQAPPSVAPVPPPMPAPDAAAEKARLDAVMAQARAALEEQQRRAAEAAAAAAATPPPPPEPLQPSPAATASEGQAPTAALAAPPVTAPASEAPASSPAAPKPAVVAKAAPKPKPPVTHKAEPTPKAAPAKPKPAPEARAEARPAEPAGAEDAPFEGEFPEVRVTAIRWHPIADRRLASLRFERQNVPNAHEGDIVSGVLVYRIDPGSVEVRVGSRSRVIRPAP